MSSLSFLFLFIQTLFFISQATVPASSTFKFVNEGEFGDYVVEYRANYRVLNVYSFPFQLCFYNTTPNAFTLALRMGTVRSELLMRWVWEANRGNPVGENATLTFGTDGNLVLADADGRVAWQTGTANKGVVGFKLLPTGNMVLHDSKGKFIWQSFDYPTDTLLVGQSLQAGKANKLVSRTSAESNSNGPYSLVLEPKGLSLYYKSNTSPRPLLYYSFSKYLTISEGALKFVTFTYFDDLQALGLKYEVTNLTRGGSFILASPKYNSSLTYLRLGLDGNLKFYTYNDQMDFGAWQVTYTLFSKDSGESECQLPERCGKFGLCEDSQCVACPSPNGLQGWSNACEAEKVASCKPSDFYYYKLDGVEHFVSKYTKGDGPMKEDACGSKCTKECKCLGYFYHKDTSKCWIAYELKTLTKVANSAHVGYIKTPNH